MKKASKAIAIAMASAMAVSMAACGGSASSSASGATTEDSASATGNGSYDQVTYAYATFNNIPTEEDLDVVEEEINKITREKIGAEITLKPISIADYVNKVSLSLQGGEKIDVYQSLGNFGNCVSTDMCYDISDLIDSCAPETKALLGDKFLDACKVNGKLYGIPTYKPFALTPMFIYRKDIADELGIDMSTVNSVEDVTPILEQVKKAKSDMIPLAPVQNGVSGLEMTMGDIDWLSDDYYKPVGVLMDGNMTVQDLYTTDTFKSRCDLARTWYNEGLIMKDAATTTSTAAECMSSGNYFGYIAAYSYPEADTAASLQAQCGGFELGAKMIGDAYLGTGDINAVSWMIASTTDVPEAALKFLNLTYTDKDIVNLLIYGIEGRDYIMNDDGTVSYPEGEDSTTVPYTAQLSCGTLGNFFIMYPTAGTDPASLEWEQKQNEEAKTSPAMGFTFDSSKLNTQYTAVKNAISQYLPGLLCGSVDPNTELAKSKRFNTAATIILTVLVIITLLPLALIVISSFTKESALIRNGYSFWPQEWSLDAYYYMIKQGAVILRSYGVSVFVTAVGTAASVILTTMLAYPMSRKSFKYHNALSFFVFFTMLFNGGIVPSYIMWTKIFHIKDTIFALLIPNYLVTAFNVILVKNYYANNIPDSLIEAAEIDGATEMTIFRKIMLPLAVPTVATISLFTGLCYWKVSRSL